MFSFITTPTLMHANWMSLD